MIKEYPYTVEDGAMQLIANTLHFIGTDPERRSWLATEREAYRTYYIELEGIEKELEESHQVIAEMQLEVDQERKARLEKEQENERLLRELAELKNRLNG